MAEIYALLSVSDKRGIVEFARRLLGAGYQLISTGGTARVLNEAGLKVLSVAELTGFDELLDGRVKTLHPKIHAALLARRDLPSHQAQLAAHQVPDIRLVVVNLYPFQQTIMVPGTTFEAAIEQIDVGGSTMLRAAAKNHASVGVVVDRGDYERVADALEAGGLDESTRRELALKAFRHSADYEAAIAAYFAENTGFDEPAQSALPACLNLRLERAQTLRYGENPHQAAALYQLAAASASAGYAPRGAEQLHGKALSYNNLVDLDAALELVDEFGAPACAIIKHTNPAGCALGADIDAAYHWALDCDPKSAFGGIVALNRLVSASLARQISGHFFEIIAAPDFEPAALEILQKKKNLRLIRLLDPEKAGSAELSGEIARDFAIRATWLGYLVQQVDARIGEFSKVFRPENERSLQIPTRRKPSAQERATLEFVWKVAKHVKSNAIVLGASAGEGAQKTIGVGAGQMSRVDAVELAIKKMRTERSGDLGNSVLASDAFFPFRDGIDAAAAAGVRAVIQPGGSVRDQEVIEACDEHGIAMILTSRRHFRH